MIMMPIVLVSTGQAIAAPPTPTVTLKWTAPGDDGTRGRAKRYDLRIAFKPITETTFDTSMPLVGAPIPGLPGAREQMRIPRYIWGLQYYVAVKTIDEAGNRSSLSNVVLSNPQTVDIGDAEVPISFSQPFPNPAQQSVRCAYTLPRAAPVRVDVFDVSGRLVRTIASGIREAGAGELAWDLRDESGARVSAGVYMMHARLADETWTRSMVVAR